MKVQVNSQNKVYTDNNKALIAQEGGGDVGYNVYVEMCVVSSDYIYVVLNGTERFRMDEALSRERGTNWHNIGKITSILIEDSDHWYDYGTSDSSSWARMCPHGTGAWTHLHSDTTYTLTEDIDLQIWSGTCLNKGTLITMANDTYKPVEEIEVGDYVKGYDGKSLKVLKSQKGQRAFGEDRDIWKFEKGYEVITTYRHRFYNIEHQRMMYLNEWQIGEHAYSEKGEKVALLEHIHEDTPCMHFSLWCEEQNYFAGGLLAGNRFTKEIKL